MLAKVSGNMHVFDRARLNPVATGAPPRLQRVCSAQGKSVKAPAPFQLSCTQNEQRHHNALSCTMEVVG